MEAVENSLVPVEVRNEIEAQVKNLIEQGTLEKISTPVEYQNAAVLVKEIHVFAKQKDEQRMEITKKWRTNTSDVNDYFRGPLDTLKGVVRNIDRVMIVHKKEEERKAIEKQRKLDEEARKQREAEARKAEEQRLKQYEADRKAEEARKKAENAKTEAAREKALKEQQRQRKSAEEARLKEQAAEKKQQTIVSEKVVSNAPKVAGISERKTYFGTVLDKKTFVQHCLKQNQLHLLDIDMTGLNRIINASKGEMAFPGIKADYKFTQVKRR